MLIEVMLPTQPLRLVIGSGAIAWGEKTFSDVDATFGTFADLDEIEDGVGDQAPGFGFSMFPASNAAAADLSSSSRHVLVIADLLDNVNNVVGKFLCVIVG